MISMYCKHGLYTTVLINGAITEHLQSIRGQADSWVGKDQILPSNVENFYVCTRDVCILIIQLASTVMTI